MAKPRDVLPAQVSTTTRATRQALKEKTNTTRSKTARGGNGGKTKNSTKTTKSQSGRSEEEEEVIEEETVLATRVRVEEGVAEVENLGPQSNDLRSTTKAQAKTNEKPRAPTGRLGRKPRQTQRDAMQNPAQEGMMAGLKKSMEATARGQRIDANTRPESLEVTVALSKSAFAKSSSPKRPSQRKSTSSGSECLELSLSSSPPRTNNLNSARDTTSSMIHAGTFLRAQGTPAVESSILALRNFKRRPRQPSMLQMVQQRTASARPSPVRAMEHVDTGMFDLDLNSDNDDDDFAPEAEGTPLHVGKTRHASWAVDQKSDFSLSTAANPANHHLETKKRKSDDFDCSSTSLKARSAKRIKISHFDQNDNFVTALENNISAEEPLIDQSRSQKPQRTPEVQVISSSTSSTPRSCPQSPDQEHELPEADVEVPSTEKNENVENEDAPLENPHRRDAEKAPNSTMAEPLSSSPAPEDQNLKQKMDEQELAPFQPSRTRQRKPKQNSKPISTATLQAMLPRRRKAPPQRPRKSQYDIESEEEEEIALDASHLDDNEDELGARLHRQPQSASDKARTNVATKKARPSKTAISTSRKVSAAQARKNPMLSAHSKGTKTYGRKTTTDQENEGDESFEEADESTLPEISLSMHEAAKSKELEEAKRKFAEIDNWDMEMESMSAGNHGSSSPGWR